MLVGSLLAIAFLFVSGGKKIALQGNSVGTGGYRLQRATDLVNQPQVANGINNSTSSSLVETNGSAKTAVLDLITTTPTTNSQSPIATEPLSPQRLSLAETLDNISYRIIGLGFPLLTIGIIAGAVWANEAWGSYWSWDPKETWALITWLVFAAYLHARITRGWQGRRPAILAATGFVVVWVCYLGVNLLGKGLHSYGWFF